MEYTLTKWMCRDCARIYYDKGYGSEARTNPDYSDMQCENDGCTTHCWMLIQFRIPEKDIQFRFVVSYRHWIAYHVKVDGRFIHTESSGSSPAELEFISSTIKDDDQIDDWAGKTMGHTISWKYADEFISDDILEAYRIYANDPTIKRSRYMGKIENPKDPYDDWRTINQYVYVY